jgi:hypothetical protein
MEGGKVRLTGSATEVMNHPEIASLYLGGTSATTTKTAEAAAEPVAGSPAEDSPAEDSPAQDSPAGPDGPPSTSDPAEATRR